MGDWEVSKESTVCPSALKTTVKLSEDQCPLEGVSAFPGSQEALTRRKDNRNEDSAKTDTSLFFWEWESPRLEQDLFEGAEGFSILTRVCH